MPIKRERKRERQTDRQRQRERKRKRARERECVLSIACKYTFDNIDVSNDI